MSVLRAVPQDLPLPIRKGGGVREWLWGGPPRAERARISVTLGEGHVARFKKGNPQVKYELVFGEQGGSFVVLDERLENDRPAAGETEPYFYFKYQRGRPILNANDGTRKLRREEVDPTQSILSQRKDSESYPEITRLAASLGQIRIYRSWSFGPDAVVRESNRADERNDRLSETFDNLAGRLAVLKKDPAVKKLLLSCIRELAPGFDDIEIVPEGGRLQLYLTEGGRNTPAHRLSDGTLRFLCLVAILLDPSPPPLVVIEEPELGLHPDSFPILHDLLIDASQRCQLLVTTHSVNLVDAFTERPEAVLVVDKREGSTLISQVKPAEGEGLSSQWLSGQIGGTRW
ncbi:MAG: AAA family ATPase [Polyangiaceae bacterium]